MMVDWMFKSRCKPSVKKSEYGNYLALTYDLRSSGSCSDDRKSYVRSLAGKHFLAAAVEMRVNIRV